MLRFEVYWRSVFAVRVIALTAEAACQLVADLYGMPIEELIALPEDSVIGVKASATLTHNGTALADGNTVTIGSRVYTYKTVLTGAVDEVLIGAATASLANLQAAVNGEAGAGTTYGAGTAAHADVDATALTANTVLDFEAKLAGVAGNLISKGKAAANLSWNAGTTFTGGA